jgi:two-component system response regulator GlrR
MNQTRGQILLVDDDDSLLQLLVMRLEAAGYTVRTARSGAEALSRIAEQAPAVVISDLRMPGMDGIELFRRIHARWNQLPVIILTAHGTIPDAVMATQSGLFAFLTKPVDKKDLLLVLEKALQFGGSAMPPRKA